MLGPRTSGDRTVLEPGTLENRIVLRLRTLNDRTMLGPRTVEDFTVLELRTPENRTMLGPPLYLQCCIGLLDYL